MVAQNNDFFSKANQFKRFIEAPPVIDKVVWERSNPDNTNVVKKYYSGKWQPGAGLINCAPNLELAENETSDPKSSEIRGRYEKTYWGYFDDALTTWEDVGRSDEATNYVLSAYNRQISKLDNTINFGITYAEAGCIRWQDDSFIYTNQAQGHILRGKLARDKQDRAHKISLDLELVDPSYAERIKFRWEILYGYEADIGFSFLPSSFRYYQVIEAGLRKLDEIKIHRLITNASHLPSSAFAAAGYVKAGQSNTYLVQGKSIIYQNAQKQWTTIAPAQVSDVKMSLRTYRLFAAIIFLGPSLMLFLWMRKIRKNKQTK